MHFPCFFISLVMNHSFRGGVLNLRRHEMIREGVSEAQKLDGK